MQIPERLSNEQKDSLEKANKLLFLLLAQESVQTHKLNSIWQLQMLSSLFKTVISLHIQTAP